MAVIKKLYFANGVAVTAPTDLTSESSTVKVNEYADDAAFVTANGTAQGGDVYINTTLKALRLYTGSAWRTVIMSNDVADPTKTFLVDIDGATTGTSATLDFNQTANRTYTFPDSSGLVVLNSNTVTDPTVFSGATGITTIGNASGTVVFPGNVTVNGTTINVNTTNLDVTDKNIKVNNGGDDTTAEGAGLTVDRAETDGSLIYKNASATKWAAGAVGAEVDLADISTAQTFTNKSISGSSNTISDINLASQVTGTLPIGSGGTGETTANTALNALLPVQTGENGKYLQTDGTNTSWQPATGGGGSESVLLRTNTDYTVLDGDGYTTILFSTGASDRTLTLPLLANNANRIIRVKKIDTGAGNVIIDGNGSELVEGAATFTLRNEDQAVTLQAESEWYRLGGHTKYAETTGLTIANVSNMPGISVVRQIFRAYQTESGKWFLKINLAMTGSGGSSTNDFTFSISDVLFKNTGDYDQPVLCNTGGGGLGQSSAYNAFAKPNTNEIRVFTTLAQVFSSYYWSFNGEVELESKPSWA
jgi:hypothetical protein